MLPWQALPLNTIGIIIALSVLIPTSVALILIKIKRYEELGWIIGIFLIILSLSTFFYLIPNEIVSEARIPDDYIWEDEGNIYYWERNTVFFRDDFNLPEHIVDYLVKRDPIQKTFLGKEIIHVTQSNKYENKAIINDALYDENGEIFTVLNDLEPVSEWYEIDTHLTSLEYVNVEAGHMGIPSDLGNQNEIRIGWVDSNGNKDSPEEVVLIRDMKKIKTGYMDGIELSVWQSDITNKEIVWHGEPYLCDETLRLTVHTKTGYIVNVYRHLVLSAHLSQFVNIYYPEWLESKLISRYLKSSNPIGEGAELVYETTDESQARHIAEAASYDAQLTFYPIIICIPMLIIGLCLIWRYCGRAYYWKRYKDFETNIGQVAEKEIDKKIVKRKFAYKKIRKFTTVAIAFVLILTTVSVVINGTFLNKDSDFFLFEEKEQLDLIEDIPPTPPGTNRGIDSGRHILEAKDEGFHRLLFEADREWWYYNVFFDIPGTDLEGWSMIISFNKMAPGDLRFVKRDNFFMVLYDNESNHYDFNILNQRRGTLKYKSSGVDIQFKNNWAKGTYPNWQVHGEVGDMVVDLSFAADFMPVWVEGRSSNLPLFGKYWSGDYYIPRCFVEGTIMWDGIEYTVYGKGYHDHVWESNVPRFVTKGWDWANFHFDNGWEIYLSQFLIRWPPNSLTGALLVSPNDRNIVEWGTEFTLEYVEEKKADGYSAMSYPTKYHLEASREDMKLELDIELYNAIEIVWKHSGIGMFEGPCRVTGTFAWSGNIVELNGYGMTEVTRVKYLFESLIDRIKELFS